MAGEIRGIVPCLILGIAVIITLLGLSESATFSVGGRGGWTFNVNNWPKGKTFKAGDVLVFNYKKGVHNVVAVQAKGYKGCTKPSGAKVLQSGHDRVTLKKGHNFFICALPGHCKAGMRIDVNAL